MYEHILALSQALTSVNGLTVNALTHFLRSNPSTFNGKRTVGLCKLLTLNAVNF
jgi:hypothetical protein